MVSDDEFTRWCEENGLQGETRTIIQNIRSSPPSRRVKSGTKNVSGRFPSQKMETTIQFESHQCELPYIYRFEHDDDVLEYYDQPPPITITYQNNEGRTIGFNHTPDFFLLRSEQAGWVECKLEKTLQKKAQKQPNLYQYDEETGWQCPPGEAHAHEHGLGYWLYTDQQIDWTLQRNLRFLEDYFREPYEVEDSAQARLHDYVKSHPGLRLSKLLDHHDDADDVYASITNQTLYVDLSETTLKDPDDVRVFVDAQTAQVYRESSVRADQALSNGSSVELESGTHLHWDGNPWVILNAGERSVSLFSEPQGKTVDLPRETFLELLNDGSIQTDGEESIESGPPEPVLERLRAAREDHLKEASRRARIVQQYRDEGSIPDVEEHPRTVRRWAYHFEEARQVWGNGYVGLIPRHDRKGNPGSKLPKQTQSVLITMIEEEYETTQLKNKREVFGEFLLKCEEEGVPPCSYRTFVNYINQRDATSQTKKRKGRRSSYQKESFHWALEMTTPRHGDRPFEIGHIDHTQLDIELVSSSNGQNLGRPWVTFLTDAYSRRLLAIYLTFEEPSTRSCMMILRECVRRHNRLPNTLVVDQGKEFESVYFESLLARYGVTKKTRPAAKARYGSVCERLFRTANTQLIHNLAGNTQIMKNVREVTSSTNPKNLAEWTLEALYEALCQWGYELYDTLEHPALDQTPREAFQQSLNQHGQRTQTLIPYDEEFRIMTLPSPSQRTRKVTPARGVKYHYIFYWDDAFRDPQVEGTNVPLRYDPYDAGRVYAYVNDQWVECISELYPVFENRSRREVKLATEEIRRERTKTSQSHTLTARRIARFLKAQEEGLASEKDQKQAKADEKLRARMNGDGKSEEEEESGHADEVEAPGWDGGSVGEPAISSESVSGYGEYGS